MPLPFERLFTLAAFEGLRALRVHFQQQPHLTLQEVVQVVVSVERDAETFDMDAATELYQLFPKEVPNEGQVFYRTCVEVLLASGGHNWGRQIVLGRKFFTRKLDRDQLSVFNQAGLLDDPPDDDIVTWWDQAARVQRLRSSIARDERSRSAEKLTIQHETARLRAAGRNETPVWMSVEDNTVGYDVMSYTLTPFGAKRLQIEVKSSISNPLEFHVTRNEWRVAQKFGEAYVFHIWDMRQAPPVLHVRTVAQVNPHIPHDNEDGEWTDVIIPVGGT